MGLQKKIEYWRYHGYDKNVMLEFRDIVDFHNMRMLKNVTLISGVVSMIAVAFFMFMNIPTGNIMACFLGGTVHLMLSIISGVINKDSQSYSSFIKNVIMEIAIFSVSVESIYVGSIGARNELAVTCTWLFLFLGIVFDFSPVRNLRIIPIAMVFMLCSYLYKDSIHVVYDGMHMIMAVLIGQYMSWHKSKIRLDSLVIKKELYAKNKKLYESSIMDSLTGIYNRKQIFEVMESVLGDCLRQEKTIACLIMDLDDFKAYNDFYGHPQGDRLLHLIGSRMKKVCDAEKVWIGRIGGEEFMALWQVEDCRNPEAIAHAIRTAITDMKIPHRKSSVEDYVTISQGLFINKPLIGYTDANAVYSMADKALYRAKWNGKNQCHILSKINE